MYTLKCAIEETDFLKNSISHLNSVEFPGVPIAEALYAIAATLAQINRNLERIADRIDEAADE